MDPFCDTFHLCLKNWATSGQKKTPLKNTFFFVGSVPINWSRKTTQLVEFWLSRIPCSMFLLPILEAETLKFLDSTTIFEGLTKKQKVSLAEAETSKTSEDFLGWSSLELMWWKNWRVPFCKRTFQNVIPIQMILPDRELVIVIWDGVTTTKKKHNLMDKHC